MVRTDRSIKDRSEWLRGSEHSGKRTKHDHDREEPTPFWPRPRPPARRPPRMASPSRRRPPCPAPLPPRPSRPSAWVRRLGGVRGFRGFGVRGWSGNWTKKPPTRCAAPEAASLRRGPAPALDEAGAGRGRSRLLVVLCRVMLYLGGPQGSFFLCMPFLALKIAVTFIVLTNV